MSGRAATAARGARLGTTGSSSGNEFDHLSARERRFELRRKARRYVDREQVPYFRIGETGARVQDGTRARGDKYLACGKRLRATADSVSIRWGGEGTRAGYGDLQTCGSVHSCPVCAAKISQERNDELRSVLDWARREQHTLAMITLTVRHKQTDELRLLLNAISDGWANVTGPGKGVWISEDKGKFSERLDKWETSYREAVAGRGRFPRNGRRAQELEIVLEQLSQLRDTSPAMSSTRAYAEFHAQEVGDELAACRPQRGVGDQERYGIKGWARVLETTHGSHGWHPHVHVVMVFEAESREQGVRNAYAAADRVFDRWNAGLQKSGPGFYAIRDSGGLDVAVSEAAELRLADYLTKDQGTDAAAQIENDFHAASGGLAAEATLGHSKLARRSGRTPFQILAAIDYDADPVESAKLEARWREWVRESEGRRQMTWSKGLRELAGLAAEERSDEEIAAADEGDVEVLRVPRESWATLEPLGSLPLDVLEVEGIDGLKAFLHRGGWEYHEPPTVAQTEWLSDPPGTV